MENNENKIKTPRNAMDLYIKLYCKKRVLSNKGKTLLSEAIKSWLSLNESEKSVFTNKYNECNSLLQHKVAIQLKRANPYMKKKKVLQPIKESSEEIDHLNNTSAVKLKSDEDNIMLEKSSNINNISCFDGYSNGDINIFNDSKWIDNTKPEENDFFIPEPEESEIFIPEPTPPVLLTGEDLFQLIKKNKETDTTWSELSIAQKRQFQNAVLAIKRTYIKQYKTYLENCSSERLIEHYKNVKNHVS